MKDYTKHLLIVTVLILAAAAYIFFENFNTPSTAKPSVNHNILLQSVTDDRGLTSVIFIDEKKDTVGLDYIDKKEFDSLFNRK